MQSATVGNFKDKIGARKSERCLIISEEKPQRLLHSSSVVWLVAWCFLSKCRLKQSCILCGVDLEMANRCSSEASPTFGHASAIFSVFLTV